MLRSRKDVMNNKKKAKLQMMGLKSLLIFMGVSVIGFVVCFVKLVLSYGNYKVYDEGIDVTYVGLTLLCLVAFVVLVLYFRTSYKKVFVSRLLEFELPGCCYSRYEGFGQGLIDSSIGLVEPGNKYKSEDYISGNYKGIHFEQADVLIQNEVREKSRFSDDTKIKVYKHFKGRMIVMDSPVNVKKPIYIYSYNFDHRYKGQHFTLTSVETKDKVFGDVFSVLVSAEGSSVSVLTDKMKNALLTTYNKFYNMAVRFEDKKMYIAINTKEDCFDWKITRGLNYRKEIETNRNQIYVIKDIIDILKGEEKAEGTDVY